MANRESFLTFNSFNLSPLTVDLNHIFLFLAVISPLVVLARAWRPGPLYRGWRIAALVVLIISVVAWILTPRAAGYVGGFGWVGLFFFSGGWLRKICTTGGSGGS